MATLQIKKEQIRSVDPNTIDGLVPVAKGGTNANSFADKAVIISQDAGADTLQAAVMDTNGQILIGGTSGPAAAALGAGDGIAKTEGDGSLSIAADLKANSGLVIDTNKISLDLGASSITGTLAVADGGTGTTNGSITGSSVLAFATSGGNNGITLSPHGQGAVDLPAGYDARTSVGANSVMPKSYIDGLINGVSWKDSVVAASTGGLTNVTFNNTDNGRIVQNAGAFWDLDGHRAGLNDRVLIKNESGANEGRNGIYYVKAIGNSSYNKGTLTITETANGNMNGNLVTVTLHDSTSEVFKFDNTGGNGPTGSVVGGQTIVDIQGMSGADVFAAELVRAIDIFFPLSKVYTGESTGAAVTVGDITGNGGSINSSDFADFAEGVAQNLNTNVGAANGTLERVLDANSASELTQAAVFVQSGTTQADEGYVVTSDITSLNNDPVVVVQFTGLGSIIAGDGISKTGNTLSADLSHGLGIASQKIILNINEEKFLDNDSGSNARTNGVSIGGVNHSYFALNTAADNATFFQVFLNGICQTGASSSGAPGAALGGAGVGNDFHLDTANKRLYFLQADLETDGSDTIAIYYAT